jgi:chemotaxis signal transduction protein
VQLVVFTLDRDRYALPVERVREVIRHRVPAGVMARGDAPREGQGEA